MRAQSFRFIARNRNETHLSHNYYPSELPLPDPSRSMKRDVACLVSGQHHQSRRSKVALLKRPERENSKRSRVNRRGGLAILPSRKGQKKGEGEKKRDWRGRMGAKCERLGKERIEGKNQKRNRSFMPGGGGVAKGSCHSARQAPALPMGGLIRSK